jgi:hypothetical protein
MVWPLDHFPLGAYVGREALLVYDFKSGGDWHIPFPTLVSVAQQLGSNGSEVSQPGFKF